MIHTMVVNVLSSLRRSSSARMCCLLRGTAVLELSQFRTNPGPVLFHIAMTEFSIDLRSHVVLVRLWQCLLVLYRLNSSMIMILVDFSVHCFCSFFMSVRLHGLACHSRIHAALELASFSSGACKAYLSSTSVCCFPPCPRNDDTAFLAASMTTVS